MQAIPTTGMAQGVQYLERKKLLNAPHPPVVVCSLGDGSVTEGEVSEAWQFAVLKQLPIIYLVQDNDWGISVSADEMRAMDAYEYAAGFKGMKRVRVDGSDFIQSYLCLKNEIEWVRENRKPVLIHAKVALLNHHTSGVRKEMYRSAENLAEHAKHDPLPILHQHLLNEDFEEEILFEIDERAKERVATIFKKQWKRRIRILQR